MFRSISQLEAYYWVARLGSFRAAAGRLNVSQPSITARIRELETVVGAELFVRRYKGVHLTEQGNVLYDHVDKVITLLSEMSGHFLGASRMTGTLRLGVPDGFAETCLSSFLHILNLTYPDLSSSIRVDNSRALIRRLEEGALDIAVLTKPKISSAYTQEYLGSLEMIWVSAPSKMTEEEIDPVHFSRERVVINPLPSPTYTILTNWFEYHKLVPSRLSTCNNIATIVKVVEGGQALTIIPKCIVRQQLEDGRLVELNVDPPLPRSEMYVVYPKRAMNRGMKEIAEVFHASLEGNDFVEKV